MICTSYKILKINNCANTPKDKKPVVLTNKPYKNYMIKTYIDDAIKKCKTGDEIDCKIAWEIVEDLARSEAKSYDNLIQLTKWRLYNQHEIDPHFFDITNFDI